jgi:hexosaminidase
MMRRRAISALALGLAFLPSAGAADAPAVVPQPASIERVAGEFRITRSTPIVTARDDAAARRVAANFADLVARSTGLRLSLRDAASSGAIQFRRVPSMPGGNEAYRLEVRPKGVVVSAAGDAGLVHGATTLWQLMAPGPKAMAVPAVNVEDAPRFAWRGIMLDSARHFQSPKFITDLIDWMALHKLNVLHWHLTDDQAWRLEIRKYPRLAQVGGWRVPAGAAAQADIDAATGKPRLYGGYYSQETVRSIVSYAADRGITIVPEIEMPGHATAAIVAYPQLAATTRPPSAVPADWGIYPNLYSLEETTFAFIEDVLTEVMALFPSTYIHVGGDEAEHAQWKESPRAKARLAELGLDENRAQPYFTQRVGRFLESKGRRLVGWDEILEPGLAPGAVVMSWRGVDGAVNAANKGHDTVIAAHPILYFDNRQGASPEEPPGRGRVVSLKDVYGFEPVPAGVAGEAARHVLGLQANVWTEHIRTEERVAWMTFPRAAAVAELGWSQPARRNWNDFRRRMASLQKRYASVGLVAARELPEPARGLALKSQQLRLCTEDIALSLEDDAPLAGRRAVFLLDVQNPCWIYPQAPLDRARGLVAAVGQVPFNFQIGEAVKKIRFPQPSTPEGELEVRLDTCEGELLARLPLAPAAGNSAVTVLPSAAISPRSGKHDLCLRFAQPALEPMWAVDSFRIDVTP